MAGVKKIIEYEFVVGGEKRSVKSIREVDNAIKELDDHIKEQGKSLKDNNLSAQSKAAIMDNIEKLKEQRKVALATRRDMLAWQGDMEAIAETMQKFGKSMPTAELKRFQKDLQNQLTVGYNDDDVEKINRLRNVLAEVNKEVAIRNKDLKSTSSNENEAAESAKILEKVLNHEATTVQQVNEAISFYEKQMGKFRQGSQQWIYFDGVITRLKENLTQYTDEVDRAAKKANEFNRNAIMDAAGSGRNSFEDANGKQRGYTTEELTAAIKATEKLRDTTDMTTDAYRKYDEQVKAVAEQLRVVTENEKQAAEQKNLEGSRNTAGDTMRNIGSSTVEQIKEAIEVTKKLRDEQIVNSDEWKKYQLQIEAAESALNKYNDEKRKAAEEEKKFEKELEAEAELLKKRDAASRTMNHLSGSNISAIKEAVEVTKKLRDEQDLGSGEWEKYQRQIVKAEEVLARYNEKEKAIANERAKLDADRTMNNLGDSSVNRINSAIEVYKRLRDEQKAGSDGWKDYQKKIEEAQKVLGAYAEEQKRVTEEEKKLMAEMAMSDLSHATTNDIKQAIEVTKKLRDEQQNSGKQWRIYQRQIEEAEKALKSYNDVAEHKQLGESRVESMGRDVNTATADDLRNDIKVLEQWRDSIGENSAAWEKVNDKINVTRQTLTAYEEKLKSSMMAADGYKGVADTFLDLSKANSGVVVSTKNLKRAEEELKKELKDGNFSEGERVKTSEKLATVQQELARREKVLAEQSELVKRKAAGYETWKKTVSNTKATVEQLRFAQEDLKKALEKTAPNSREYKKYAEELSKVNKRLAEVNNELKQQGNWITNAAERFAKYSATWLNFYQLRDAIINSMRGTMELSDSIADIQKVTKMAAEDVDRLSMAINRLDSRSGIEALHQLGYQAGLLGLSSQADILGFVKAADQMNWALKEMGEDGAVQLMKVANLTHDVERFGVEGALTKIGSAINEITANSAASAGPVTEIISRLGTVGSTAGYASAELAAIGSTMNSLGVHTEMGATAVNKVMIALNNNLPNIAMKAGLVADELYRLKDETDRLYARGESNITGSMAVMMEVLNALNEKGKETGDTMSVLQPIFKDMGSREGIRLVTTLTTLVDNVDTLGKHVDITSDAFNKGTSMLDEYNVKNETAAALLARLQNRLKEVFVNSFVTRGLQSMLKEVNKLLDGTGRLVPILKGIVVILSGIFALNIVNVMKTIGGMLTQVWTGVKALVATLNEELTVRFLLVAERGASAGALDTETGALLRNANAWKALNLAMRHNPILAIINVLTVLGSVLVMATGAVKMFSDAEEEESQVKKKMDKAMEETTANMVEEIGEASRLFSQLEELANQEEEYTKKLEALKASGEDVAETERTLNSIHADRIKITDKINETYPEYLSNQLTEKSNQEEIQLAYNSVNIELERKLQLMVQEAALEEGRKEVKDSYNEAAKAAEVWLRQLASFEHLDKKTTEKFVQRMKGRMAVMISTGHTTEEVIEEMKNGILEFANELGISDEKAKRLVDTISVPKGNYVVNAWNKIADAIRGAVGALDDYKEKAAEMRKSAGSENKSNDARVAKSTGYKMLAQTYFHLMDVQKKFDNASAETRHTFAQEWADTYKRLEELNSRYYSNMTKEQKEWIDKRRDWYEGHKKDVLSLTVSGDGDNEPYISPRTDRQINGNGKKVGEWDEWTDEELVDKWKQLQADMNNLSADNAETMNRYAKEFGKTLDGSASSIEAAHKEYEARILKVYAELDRRGTDDYGKVKHPKKVKKAKDKKNVVIIDGIPMTLGEIKEAMSAAKAAIEAYYHDQGEELRRQYVNGNLGSQQDLDNQLKELDEKRELSMQQFYERMLRMNDNFKAEQYGDFLKERDWYGQIVKVVDKETGELVDKYENMDLLSRFLNKMGHGMQQELLNGLEKAAENVQKIAVDHMNALNKIFIQYDYMGQVDEQYKQKLTQAGLFWSSLADVNAEGSRKDSEERIKLFKEYADDILFMEEEDFRTRIEQDDRFAEWRKGRTAKEYTALYNLMRDYHDNITEAQKRDQDRRKKMAMQEIEDAIVEQKRIERIQSANEKALQSLSQEGFVSQGTVNRYEIEHLKERIKFQLLELEYIKKRGGDTKQAYEELFALQEQLEEKTVELERTARESFNKYSDALNEMMNSIVTAGNEHASLTSLAEIAAKRRLGIAVDTTKTEYMIYSRNGKAIRKMMTEEEKLTWDMENDARNQQLDALVKWMEDLGKKFSEDLTNAVSSRLALEQQKEQEQKQLEQHEDYSSKIKGIENEKSTSINMIEDLITRHHKDQVEQRVSDFSFGVQQMVAAAAQGGEGIAAGLAKGLEGLYASGPLTDPKAWNRGFDVLKTSISNMTEEELGSISSMLSDFDSPLLNTFMSNDIDAANKGNKEFLLSNNYNHFFAVVNDLVTSRLAQLGVSTNVYENYTPSSYSDFQQSEEEGRRWGITASDHEIDEVGVVAKHKEAKQEMLNTEIETNKAMTDSHKRMVLSMISAMNMYGIAYNAVMNDSLSVSQRVGLATLQSFGQVATSMLSAVLSEAIASMTIEDGKAVAKIWGTTINPAVALPLIAVVTGAIGAAMAAGTKAITKSKQEISAITGAASGKKVAAGMLTYAEGKYPVLGSDGEVYDAKRETNWKTKVYSSPHYGILGEKGPELIVDGVTTRKMMTLRPDLYQDILDLARGRQAVRAKAYAEGNYPAMPAANASGTVAGDTNAMLVAAISQLNAQLAGGIKVAALGEDGAVRRLNEAEDWMRKHGLA